MATKNYQRRFRPFIASIGWSLGIFSLLLCSAYTRGTQLNIFLNIASVQAVQVPGEPLYEISTYLSVKTDEGAPLTNLEASSFSVLNDSQPVQFTVFKNEDLDINIVVVLDISSSMGLHSIALLRSALTDFTNLLDPGDRMALITFDTAAVLASGFEDPRGTLLDQLQDLAPSKYDSACLNDALFQALELGADLPADTRAILLITDSVDLRENLNPCSVHTQEEVDALFASPGQATPMYTIGLGDDIDQATLQLLSESSQGQAYFPDDVELIPDLIQNLRANLKNQYMLRFTTAAVEGDHTLEVSASIGTLQGQDAVNYSLSALTSTLALISPQENSVVSGNTMIDVEVGGTPGLVASVDYLLDDSPVDFANEPPFDTILDFSSVAPGAHTLTTVARTISGLELARTSVTFSVPVSAEIPSVMATPGHTQQPISSWSLALTPILIIATIVVAFAALILLIFILLRKDRRVSVKSAAPPRPPHNPARHDLGFATFTVLASDDIKRVGEKRTLQRSTLSIGRTAENDWSFPNDAAVSRRHVRIEYTGGRFMLQEVPSPAQDGQLKPPTYGTFVNGISLAGSGILLKDGDQILLGKRLKIRFHDSALDRTKIIPDA